MTNGAPTKEEERLDRLVNMYTSAYENPKENMKNVAVFDELRQRTFLDKLILANIAQDPWERDREIFKVKTQFRQDLAYFMGRELKKDADIAEEDIREEYTRAGLKYLDKKFNVRD